MQEKLENTSCKLFTEYDFFSNAWFSSKFHINFMSNLSKDKWDWFVLVMLSNILHFPHWWLIWSTYLEVYTRGCQIDDTQGDINFVNLTR